MKWIAMTLIIFLTGCEKSLEKDIELPDRSFENRAGTLFTPLPENIFTAPVFKEIHLPQQENIDAIWGATGLDDEGNIYIGTSSHGGSYGSSFLYQYNPSTEELIPQSDTVSQLKYNKVYREGMRQNKLHSKFYQANDGYLYFSSFDESGESEGVNPKWGGNLWRKKPQDKNWQHVLATEEALVAVNTNGRYVYALGYWDHVLYQYDTQTDKVNRVVVGSVQEHVSRNFIVDELGHSYVPQLLENDYNEEEAYLVEYDVHLKQVERYPMPSYQSNNINKHHGIVAYTSMKNGDIYFTSSEGSLFQIKPFEKGANKMVNKGFMHPDGVAYVASLYTFEGGSYVAGIARPNRSKKFEWIIYNVEADLSINFDLNTEKYKGLLLYGSSVKNKQGDFFAGGWTRIKTGKGYRPVLQKISYNTASLDK
jgi:hypothetical protein